MNKKAGTPDFRPKVIDNAREKVFLLLQEKGYEPDRAAIEHVASLAIDEFVEQWHEVSLEAMELQDGAVDFVTDDTIDDPRLIKEARLRIIKELYEEPPEDFYRNIAGYIMGDQ